MSGGIGDLSMWGVSRLEIPKLGISMIAGNNIKLLLFRTDRKDLPHLTISWMNSSGEIDLHLTKRTSGGQEEHHRIATVLESELARLARSFEPELAATAIAALQNGRPVRPGWLGRKGYVVVHLDDKAGDRLLDTLAPAKKRKGRWSRSIDPARLSEVGESAQMIDSAYHPSILHQLSAEGYVGPVFAQQIYGRRKGHLIVLGSIIRPNGIRRWVIIDNRLIHKLENVSERFLLDCLDKLLPAASLSSIVKALCLEETGLV